MGIDTLDVLEAAATKWNFLPFKPGLVGGHCIGVDPYYLAQKAQEVGYNPEIILAGRRLNDDMGAYVASETVKLLIRNDCHIKTQKCLVLGITFKENCPDIRNSRVIDIIKGLQEYGCAVEIADPWASPKEVMHEYGLPIIHSTETIENNSYQAVVAAVGHNEFKALDPRQWRHEGRHYYDVKGITTGTFRRTAVITHGIDEQPSIAYINSNYRSILFRGFHFLPETLLKGGSTGCHNTYSRTPHCRSISHEQPRTVPAQPERTLQKLEPESLDSIDIFFGRSAGSFDPQNRLIQSAKLKIVYPLRSNAPESYNGHNIIVVHDDAFIKPLPEHDRSFFTATAQKKRTSFSILQPSQN